MNLSINDTREQTIVLPSGHYLVFRLVPVELSNLVEMYFVDSDIVQINRLKANRKTFLLKQPEDSVILEGTKVIFS